MAPIALARSLRYVPPAESKEQFYSTEQDEESDTGEQVYDKPPTKEVLTIPFREVDKTFHTRHDDQARSGWYLHEGNKTPVPNHLLPDIDPNDIRGGPGRGVSAARVRMIILTLLADRKRNGHVQAYRGTRTLPASRYKSLIFETSRDLELIWTYKCQPVRFIGRISYCLRQPAEPHPLFIIDVKPCWGWKMEHLVSYLGMMYHIRREAGLPARTTYGATTDGFTWFFIRLSEDGYYSAVNMSGFNYQWEDIMSLIGAMIDYAAGFQSGIVRGPNATCYLKYFNSEPMME